ncbi:hypothetical protein HMPREF9554_03178 [Treponema phagedenis F0421]|nr:hypothetical protein HMPREF9554_03178 [Treponema phagedenis F0421]
MFKKADSFLSEGIYGLKPADAPEEHVRRRFHAEMRLKVIAARKKQF